MEEYLQRRLNWVEGQEGATAIGSDQFAEDFAVIGIDKDKSDASNFMGNFVIDLDTQITLKTSPDDPPQPHQSYWF